MGRMPSDEYTKEEREQDVKLLDDCCAKLSEHYDTVQIFFTRNEGSRLDGTVTCNRGSGNWCARYGQIREWLVYEDERIREAARPGDGIR